MLLEAVEDGKTNAPHPTLPEAYGQPPFDDPDFVQTTEAGVIMAWSNDRNVERLFYWNGDGQYPNRLEKEQVADQVITALGFQDADWSIASPYVQVAHVRGDDEIPVQIRWSGLRFDGDGDWWALQVHPVYDLRNVIARIPLEEAEALASAYSVCTLDGDMPTWQQENTVNLDVRADSLSFVIQQQIPGIDCEFPREVFVDVQTGAITAVEEDDRACQG